MIRWWVVELPAAVVAGRPRAALLLALGRRGVDAQHGAVGRGLLGRGGGPCPTPVARGGCTGGDRAALAALGLLARGGGALDRGRCGGDGERVLEPGERKLHVGQLGLVVGDQLTLRRSGGLLQAHHFELRDVDLLRVEQRRVARIILESDRRAVHLVGVPLVVDRVLQVEAFLGLDRRGRGGVGGDRGPRQHHVDESRIARELAQRGPGLDEKRLLGLFLHQLPAHLRALLGGGAGRLRLRRGGVCSTTRVPEHHGDERREEQEHLDQETAADTIHLGLHGSLLPRTWG